MRTILETSSKKSSEQSAELISSRTRMDALKVLHSSLSKPKKDAPKQSMDLASNYLEDKFSSRRPSPRVKDQLTSLLTRNLRPFSLETSPSSVKLILSRNSSLLAETFSMLVSHKLRAR